MPVSIPFDSSLVLGQAIDTAKFDALKAITLAEKPVDDAETTLNSLIQAKLTLQSTLFQVKGLGLEVSPETATKLDELATAIANAAAALVTAKINAYGPGGTVPTALAAANAIINTTDESPISFERSQIKHLPLSSDSVIFDSQYFSFDKNDQSAQNSVASIKSFISGSVSFLGAKRSSQFSASVAQQVSTQQEKHDVIGTLVITARTSHEDAKIITPMVLDVEKAIRIWNATNSDAIKEGDFAEMMGILTAPPTSESINLLSGVTVGSAFVGMVHVLRSESTDTSQRMLSVSSSLQTQMKRGGWFARMQGGFGANKSFSDDVKRLLSKQEISSHCSIVCLGVIPNIRSNQVQLGVKKFADFDPASMMRKLATLANYTTRQTNSVDISAEAARTGQRMVLIRGAEIENVISSLGKIDDGANQMLDINSLMTAFEDFVGKVAAGNAGVPINFYVSSITKPQLAQAWMDENFPDGPPVLNADAEVGIRSFEIPRLARRSAPRAARFIADGPPVLNADAEVGTRSFAIRSTALRSAPREAPTIATHSIEASPSISTNIRTEAGLSDETVDRSGPAKPAGSEVSSALEVSREALSFIRPERSSMMSNVTDVSAGGPSETLPSRNWRAERDKLTLSLLTEQSQDEGK